MSAETAAPDRSRRRRLLALTRDVSPRFAACELSHLGRQPIDVGRAHRQHRAYQRKLEVLGCEVRTLAAEPELPDSVFVEDAAVVVDELAVITRPGAPSRRPETPSVAEALAPLRRVTQIVPPGSLDGGDVLRVGRRIWAGRSRRSNREGIRQLASHLEPLGYAVEAVAVGDCLHLKSAATRVGPELLLVNPEWVDPRVFHGLDTLAVDPAEPFAANALRVGDAVLYPRAFAATRQRLESSGLRVVTVDVSEIAKAEGGVTCCSLVFAA